MHTLPYPAAAGTLGWSPSINTVVVCGSTGGIGLYRSSGQLVWSVSGKKGAVARRTLWRHDGNKLAILYEDGSVQILNTSTGRSDEVKCTAENVCSLAWPLSRQLVDLKNHFIAEIAPFSLPLTFGLKSGELSLSIFGLSLPGIKVMDQPIEHICVNDGQTSYAVAGKTTVAVLESSYASEYGEILPLITEQPAQLARMLSTLCAGVQMFEALYQSVLDADQRFFGHLDESGDAELIGDILYEYLQEEDCDNMEALNEWMNTEHENGFKRWYKAMTSKFDEIRQLFNDNLLKIPTQLLTTLGAMAGAASVCESKLPAGLTPSDIDELTFKVQKISICHSKIYKWLQQAFYCFDALAGVLQRRFTDAISRSIVVVPADSFKPRDALLYFINHYATPCLEDEEELLPSSQLKDAFEEVHIRCQQLVSATFKVVQTYDISLTALHLHNNEFYGVTTDMYVGKLRGPSAKITGSGASFSGDRVAVTDGAAVRVYTLEGTLSKEKSLDYEAGAVSIRESEICTLSHDLHHIDMFTI